MFVNEYQQQFYYAIISLTYVQIFALVVITIIHISDVTQMHQDIVNITQALAPIIIYIYMLFLGISELFTRTLYIRN